MTRPAPRARTGSATAATSAALVAAMLPFAAVAHGSQPSSLGAKACRTARGPFHVTGTKVIGAHGRVFVPYGITVPGLGNSKYRPFIPLDDAKIRATARSWCANTVRLQIGQANLVGANGRGFSRRFLAAVEGEVKVAEKSHLVVVLNAQTENLGNQPAPTKATVLFWKDLSRVYRHDPQVIFDLFNQPRISTQVRCGNTQDWRLWHTGGRFLGHSYVGMQSLVRDVRVDGARNLIWVEGPCFANSLSKLGSHLIKGRNIVYAFEHPHGTHDAAQWYADFGWVVFRHIGPVVDAEWTNYAAAKSECWPDAPKAVPAFLRYLARRGIGLTGYQLKKGLLIRTANLADPTRINTSGRRKWRCANGLDEGVGADLMNWFRHQNS
ncbi:MAG TPA: cellulase family glycosylhydrolase [Streptosporangiaceae bacterium]|nr:cellulase family glycosylhydrolase [Streptosporangiaceae bacterium]